MLSTEPEPTRSEQRQGQFCAQCGAGLARHSKFCPTCGHVVASGPDFSAATAATRSPSTGDGKAKALLGGAALLAALCVGTLGAWQFGWLGMIGADSKLVAPADSGDGREADVARPASWFETYADKFLSGGVVQYVTGTAQKRNYPTSQGSTVLATLQPGERLAGRWVEGADLTTRWLRTDHGGYVWDGNLAGEDEITPRGMLGMTAGTSYATIRGRLNPVGNYGSQDAAWDSYACETYSSGDGRVDVMVLEGKVGSFSTADSSLRTSEGIRVGSSEHELVAAYAEKLKREENPYEGVDYFAWSSPERGIKFSVSDGVVKAITSGGGSINYVEGCL